MIPDNNTAGRRYANKLGTPWDGENNEVALKTELSKSINIRPFRLREDLPSVQKLWDDTLGAHWTNPYDDIRECLTGSQQYRAGDHLLALEHGKTIGFVATQTDTSQSSASEAGLLLLMVSPERQRQGIGSLLLDAAIVHLRDAGVNEVRLGQGPHSYFWAGVPDTCRGAARFFEINGWRLNGSYTDMVCDVRTISDNGRFIDKMNEQGFVLKKPTENDLADLLAFEQLHFPDWHEYFCETLRKHGSECLLVAKSPSGEIIGTAVLTSASRGSARAWCGLLGDDMGAFGCVGVRSDLRGRGIGAAITMKALLTLRTWGVKNCYIHWVWSTDWYRKFGCTAWRSFRRGVMTLK